MNNYQEFSTRANVVTRRTYNRPKEDGTFETWEETVDRVIEHQKWLWERAKANTLDMSEIVELDKLRTLMLERKATVSGRTLWLGGTNVAKTREASQFNCSFGRIETVHDIVDAMWLLLQGCGVGFEPVVGTLNGFAKKVNVRIVRSAKVLGEAKGCPDNQSWRSVDEVGKKTYHLKIGDSAEAWAKSAGKLFAMKDAVDVLILDFSEVRAAGERLKGYGWISSGDETVSSAFQRICDLLNDRAGQLLTRIDILDVLNHLGTTLSSRRSAEIALMPVSDPEVDNFISAKKDFWLHGNEHRQQSNNSIVFHKKPTQWELSYIFDKMIEAGGSEPGFINAESAKKRAPHFKGVNPCAEILLGNKSFCNLVEVDWGKFLQDFGGLQEAVEIVARANYRQTCVNLDDGVLQRSWHELEGVHKPLGKYLFNNVTFSKHDEIIPKLVASGYKVIEKPFESDSVLVTFPVAYEDVKFDLVDGKEVNLETAISQLDRYKLMMDHYVDHNCSVTISYDNGEIPDIITWILDNWDTYVGVSFIYRNDPTKSAADLGYAYLPQEVVSEEDYRAYANTLMPVDLTNLASTDDLTDEECLTGACPRQQDKFRII